MDPFNLLACSAEPTLMLFLYDALLGMAGVLQFLVDNKVVIGPAVLGPTLLASVLFS